MALTTSPDVLPEAMRFLVRAILALSNDVDRDELITLVAPAGLVEAIESLGSDGETLADDDSDLKTGGSLIAKQSLAALGVVGIVTTTRGRVSLSAVPEEWRKPADVDSLTFSKHLRNRIFASADPSVSVGESGDVMDLVHGIGFLHKAHTPLRPFSTFEPDKAGQTRAFEEDQRSLFGDDRTGWPIPNKQQWLPFRRLATYIGLASFSPSGLIADASTALIHGLSELPSAQYDIEQFVAECAQAVPILDGGPLEFPSMKTESSHSLLSPGLAVSIQQLEADGLVVLSKLSDIGTRTLRVGTDNNTDRLVSHVKWTGITSRKAKR